MNSPVKYSQFVYGKFYSHNSGYCLVACSPNCKYDKDTLKDIAKTYHFGTDRDGNFKKAIGIYYKKDKDQLLIIQSGIAIDENNRLLGSGGTEFYQYRYFFLPSQALNQFQNISILLLEKLFHEWIPYFEEYNQPGFSQTGRKWWEINSDVLNPSAKEIFFNSKEEIVKLWNDTASSERQLIKSVLAAVLNKKFSQANTKESQSQKLQIILTCDSDAMNPMSFVKILLLMLPAIYRKHISIAMGSIDEKRCSWADIIVKKKNSIPKKPLSDECIWIDRNSKEIVGNFEQNIFENRYVEDFFDDGICEDSEAISVFIQYLNTLIQKEFIIPDFTEPKKLIYLITGLPQKYQTKLWRKYILEFSTDCKSIKDWESVIGDFVNDENLWQALIQLSYEAPKFLAVTTLPILVIIRQISVEHVYKKLEEIEKNLALAHDLVNAGLLEEFSSGFQNNSLDELLITICYKSIEYINQNYLVEDSTKEFISFVDRINKSDKYQKLFSSPKEIFNFLDISLENKISAEVTRIIFNKYLIFQLAPIDDNFSNSNLSRQLQDNFSNVANKINKLLTNKAKALNCLPEIAKEMEIDSTQIDLVYSDFLNAWLPKYEDAYVILIDVIKKVVKPDSNKREIKFSQTSIKPIYQTKKEENITFNIHSFSSDIKAFSRTYEWFKGADTELGILLKTLEKHPMNWDSWNKFVNYIEKEPLEQIYLLEDIVGDIFVNKLFVKWLELIETNYNFKDHLFDKYTWNILDAKTIDNLLTNNYKKWTKSIADLVAERFSIEQERLQAIMETLLHYLNQVYLEETDTDLEDKNLWIKLTNPTILNSLSNEVWLNIFPMNWKLEVECPPPSNPLNDQQQQYFCDTAIKLCDSSTDFQKQLYLLEYCSSCGLSKEKIQQLAIKLIQQCSCFQEVNSLMNKCQNLNLNISERRSILSRTNYDSYPSDHQNLLKLFVNHLEKQF